MQPSVGADIATASVGRATPLKQTICQDSLNGETLPTKTCISACIHTHTHVNEQINKPTNTYV